MDVQAQGNMTEHRCFMKCIESGLIVSKPLFNNARYDFILDTGNSLYRIQVKSSRWANNEHSRFTFNGYSQHATGKGNKRMKYTNKEIDYFMTEHDGEYYLYPASEKGFVLKSLRVKPTKQSAGVEYAADFMFDKVIGAM